jgi:uncharacterized protein (DUF1778 family)
VGMTQRDAYGSVPRRRVMKLSGHDCKVFVEALLRPARPNKRLRQAASRYKSIAGIQ